MKKELIFKLMIFIFFCELIALIVYLINDDKIFIPMLIGGLGGFLATSYKDFKK